MDWWIDWLIHEQDTLLFLYVCQTRFLMDVVLEMEI
jgi:hypothetical protein